MICIIYIATVFYLLMSTSELYFIDRMIYGEWGGKPGDRLTQALNLLAIVVSLLLFWWGTRQLRIPRFNRILPLAAAGLLVTSVLWSVAPSITLTRGVAYFFLVVGAIGIVEILDTDEVMHLTALIGGFTAAISILLLFLLPDSVMTELGLRGLFSQKNGLGQAMVVGVLAGLHGIRTGGRRRFRYISVTLLCTIVAFLSKSATSLLTISIFFILNIIGGLYIKGKIFRIISMFLTIVFITALIIVISNIDLIYAFLDKDPTLTGRTDLWPYVIDYIHQRPVLGWGFAAFWMPSNPPFAETCSMVGFCVNEAHNGVLQLLLDVGIVGTALFLFLWVRNLVMAVKCMNGPGAEIGVSALLLLVGILLIGVSEQVLTTADGPTTAQFFLLGFMCEKSLWRARQARSGLAFRSAGAHLGQFEAPREENAA
jgi:O-antigen ligase